MGGTMTTLRSKNGLPDLNWKNVYEAATTSSTPELLSLLHGLALEHGTPSLINIGLVPVEGAFIDIDPLVWVRHVQHVADMKADPNSGFDVRQVESFVSSLLNGALQRYASLCFVGAVLGMSKDQRQLSFSRRLALFRALLALPGFRRLAGSEGKLQETWDICAQSVTADDPRFLGWLLACAGAAEPETGTAQGPAVIAARRAIKSQQRMWTRTLCGFRGGAPQLPQRLGPLVMEYLGAPCLAESTVGHRKAGECVLM
ncbi:unnamed protein product [Symbiodinium natans]|uniref:Uncharacterized protein n=1 Tax=Symbiodinium natans TaxID=878477 RepID=A0A812RKD0_9DINO|nr:unnamed protein product [Symbiodinium natans]